MFKGLQVSGVFGLALFCLAILMAGCGAPAVNTASNTHSNANNNQTISNSNSTSNGISPNSTLNASEPNEYQATIRLTLETIGQTQNASLPAIGAVIARSGSDRSMQFTLPNGNKVIYLEKAGKNYVILPAQKQFAELDQDTLGFEVRSLMMPEQIVQRVKSIPGVRFVGDETLNGRQVAKYAYGATAETGTQAGTVATEAFILIDKETGLPLRTETVSQSQSGGNVQGYKGIKLVTEMTDLKSVPEANIFALPTDFEKIDSEKVKAQVELIFNAVGALIGHAMNQPANQPASQSTPAVANTTGSPR
ncbi:MAG: hypothetical protein ABI539_01470 [Acidobacteriota bacterium]